MRMSRVHCAVLNARTRLFLVPHFHSVTAAMARGKRPVTFRTRKLSLSAPMVLPWRRGGRVGRRRTTIPEGAPTYVLGPLRRSPEQPFEPLWQPHGGRRHGLRVLSVPKAPAPSGLLVPQVPLSRVAPATSRDGRTCR